MLHAPLRWLSVRLLTYPLPQTRRLLLTSAVFFSSLLPRQRSERRRWPPVGRPPRLQPWLSFLLPQRPLPPLEKPRQKGQGMLTILTALVPSTYEHDSRCVVQLDEVNNRKGEGEGPDENVGDKWHVQLGLERTPNPANRRPHAKTDWRTEQRQEGPGCC